MAAKFQMCEPETSGHGNPPYLKKWDTVRFLGRGAFGEVHEVLTDTGIKCAAKTIGMRVKQGREPGHLEAHGKALLDGELNLRHLNHESIVKFLYLTNLSSETFSAVLFMELLDGVNLQAYVNDHPLIEIIICDVARQICSALRHMHSQKPAVIHRDIKCSNIMVLSGSNRVRLIDFDLSIKMEETEAAAHSNVDFLNPKGTLNFMAPEYFESQDSNQRPACMYSKESDIWALGCTVYQMATGTVPHSNCNNVRSLARRLGESGAPELPARCSNSLREFYQSCVVTDCKHRKSAAELLHDRLQYLVEADETKVQQEWLENEERLRLRVAEQQKLWEEEERRRREEAEAEAADRKRTQEEEEERWRIVELERRKNPPFHQKWDLEKRLIGRGAFGEIFIVLTDNEIWCAAKIIRLPDGDSDLNANRQKMKKLIEGDNGERNLCKLVHKNIVNFLSISFEPQNATALVLMELLHGETLKKFIGGRPLEEDKMAVFASQICSALNYIHSQDPPVIHRDIKGSNIMVLNGSSRIKLIDFGLSIKLLAECTHKTGSSSMIPTGTSNFMAPEIFGSESEDKIVYSRESDIWAFGCTVYQMTIGSVPYSDCNNIPALTKRLSSSGAPSLPDQCSIPLRHFYHSCVVKDRHGRRSAAELLEHGFLDKSRDCPPYLKKWDTVHLLGRGGFGEVHEVLTDIGIRCAAKTIKLPVQHGILQDVRDIIRKSIDSERNLCQLHHENIVRIFCITEQMKNSTVVVFMEYIDGMPLRQLLHSKPLGEDSIREFTRQICSALHYLHSRKPPVIHRDIKADNIMVLNEGNRIKLIDFGLSVKLIESFTHHSGTSENARGTVNFMAPELFESEGKIVYSRESDIWAFGCTVYQMVTGTVPYSVCRNVIVMSRRLDKEGAPALPDGSSAELNNFYNCCVARDRKARKSAADLLNHEFLRGTRAHLVERSRLKEASVPS